jgi:flagellar biosynthesis/type III secretory pathway M-ring protein FliF/YscJ
MFPEKLKTFWKSSSKLKKIGAVVAIIFILSFVCAILGTWTDIWHTFGKNLYHLFHDSCTKSVAVAVRSE